MRSDAPRGSRARALTTNGLFTSSTIQSVIRGATLCMKSNVRTREPCRGQVEVKFAAVDDLVAQDHVVRTMDKVVGRLDLQPLFTRWKAVEGRAGRPVTSPRMLLTLWLYAISEGVGSAQQIEALTRSHAAFAWIVGDLKPSHDVITAFRTEHGAAFSALLTDVVAALVDSGAISLDVVAQDGTRICASASSSSFRRKPALLELREQARVHVEAILSQPDDGYAAARAAKAREFARRVENALCTVDLLRETTPAAENARASVTDSDARVMKLPDGAFRPAYNLQLAVAGSTNAELGGATAIVGVRLTNSGSDSGSITPMLIDVEARSGRLPKKLLADTNHATLSCIENAGRHGVDVISPPVKKRPPKTANRPPRREDGPEVARWRLRMQTEEAKRLYRLRAPLVELMNARLKEQFGLRRLPVHGFKNVMATVLLYALATNIIQNARALLA